jgi:pimeloyl-ACP methyl ester carboxylesterase
MTEPIILETPTGKLFGALELPKSQAPLPVTLIIAGSGPTDRNGNTRGIPGANNSLKYLAEGLAAQGVASVRYDKRGVAESIKAAASESDLRFETYIDDAVLWGKQLRADKRFSSVIIIGHSEGSLIGIVAAQKMGADAFISIAGAGRPAPQALLDQLKGKLPADLQSKAEMIIKSLSEGKIVEDVPPALSGALFRRSVQPYLISYFKYDPSKEIAKLSIPVLIAQGTTDMQVPAQDAKLLAQAKPSAGLLMIEGMNHVLKEVLAEQEKQIKSYTDPSLPVAPKLIEGINSFIKAIKK